MNTGEIRAHAARWSAAGLVGLGVPLPAAAQPSAGRCERVPIGSAEVAAVPDGRTLRLADGRTVRLAWIEVPDPDAGAGAAARAALAGLVEGRSVTLGRAGAGGETDRHGRVVAQVFLPDGGAPVQHRLLAAGHARVAARAGGRACAAESLIFERRARAAKLGLWADPYYELRRAEQAAEVLAHRGRFAIVEGTVLSVRESGGTIYVNFGRRWSEDFTATIAKRNETAFAAAGLVPKQLERRRVRVRGWVEERGGPWIDVARPEQIEVAERLR